MTQNEIVKVRLADNLTAWVEARVPDAPAGQGNDVSATDQIHSFDQAVKSIEAVSLQLKDAMERIKPRRATIEMGIELAAEAGQITALFVKGNGSANFKITLEWSDAEAQ